MSSRRTPKLLAGLAGAVGLAALGWHVLHRGTQTTDDAQVEGRVVNVAARVPGQVLRVLVLDNQNVGKGDVLVELDPSDYAARVAAARADLDAATAAADGARAALALTEKTAPAGLAQAEGNVTAAMSALDTARASIDQARADVAAAASRRTLAETNLRRAQNLFGQNAIAEAEIDQRRTEYDAAAAALDQARARLVASAASVAGGTGGVVLARGRLSAAQTTSEQLASAHAAVARADARAKQAAAALDLAQLDLAHTTVRAPRAGVVSRRTVEEGQMVAPDRPLLALVPRDDVWVIANFKEDQLADVRPGQRARVRLDMFGGRDFAGHVDSIAGGTGARFALLPPDNATGNFIKVVQRIPVLVRLDEAVDVELRPGMSAEVTVVTRSP